MYFINNVAHRCWEPLILIFVLINCFGFAIREYHTGDTHYQNSDIINIAITILYFIELLIKIIATGIWNHPKSFLRSGWSYFDIYIILIGFLCSLPVCKDIEALQLLNMLRVLKLAYAIAPMRRLMHPIIVALLEMTDIFLVLLFVLLIYSMTAVSAFKGNFNMRCRTTPAPINGTWEIDESIDRLCNCYGWGAYDCPAGTYCGSPDEYGLDIPSKDITSKELTYYGTYGFDNVLRAFIANYMVITFEDWGQIMFRMADSNGIVFSQVLFMTLGFIGAFFCVNFIIAVMVNAFQAGRTEQKGEVEKKYKLSQMIEELDRSQAEIELAKESFEKIDANDSQKVIRIESAKQLIPLGLVKISANDEPEHTSCMKSFCIQIQEFTYYKPVFVFAILVNHLLLALDRNGVSEKEERIKDWFDVSIFAIFIIEMFIDIGAVGLMNYLLEKIYWIDLWCNIFGIVEVVLTYSIYSDGIFIEYIEFNRL